MKTRREWSQVWNYHNNANKCKSTPQMHSMRADIKTKKPSYRRILKDAWSLQCLLYLHKSHKKTSTKQGASNILWRIDVVHKKPPNFRWNNGNHTKSQPNRCQTDPAWNMWSKPAIQIDSMVQHALDIIRTDQLVQWSSFNLLAYASGHIPLCVAMHWRNGEAKKHTKCRNND